MQLSIEADRNVDLAEKFLGEMHDTEESCHKFVSESEECSTAIRADMTKWRQLLESEESAKDLVAINIEYTEESMGRRARTLGENSEATKRATEGRPGLISRSCSSRVRYDE